MKLSGGVEWAVHCCVVLTGFPHPVPAAKLAEFHDVSSTYLAKHLQSLARAGLVRSVQGNSGGYVLTRPPEEITVLDVVLAVEGDKPLFVCTEIRQRGPLAAAPKECTTACPVARTMLIAERAWRAALREVTIADLAHEVGVVGGEDAPSVIHQWLSGTLSPEPADR